MSPSRTVVYFAYLGDETADADAVRQRLDFMDRQLLWLADLIAISRQPTDVLVPYVAPRAWDGELRAHVERRGFRIDPQSVAADRVNSFEYPGFRAMKTLAEGSDPDDLLYYCHSKGIVQLSDAKMGLFRLHSAVGLTADLTALIENPALTRASLFPSRYGWCWYNFFWIKAGHMARLPVTESARRHDFEELIGDRSDPHGYRGVLPLIDQMPFEESGIAAKPWYRPEEMPVATMLAAYDRYARMAAPQPVAPPPLI